MRERICTECGAAFTGRSRSVVCSAYCRFWSMLDKSGGPDACWPWLHQVSSSFGYGDVPAYLGSGRRTSAHRRAWSLHNVCDPDRLLVLHRCDNPRCANPAHLFIGTQRTNVIDAWRKRRPIATAPGVDNIHAKLTEEAIREIRRTTGNTKSLSTRFGVSRSTIRRARDGKTWRHVV
jgi:hypothetical protein